MSNSLIKKVPNLLTVFRLLLVPLFLYAYQNQGFILPGRYSATVIFIIAGLSDLLDGYIARKYNAITGFGKLADPLADKMMQLTALYCLYSSKHIPAYLFFVLLIKEVMIIIGSVVMLRFKGVVQSNRTGKIAAFVISSGIILQFFDFLKPVNDWVLTLGILLGIVAMGMYTRDAINYLAHGRKEVDSAECPGYNAKKDLR